MTVNRFIQSLAGLALLCISFFSAAATVVHEHRPVSRDFTYISFHDSKTPYDRTDIVGGEHMSYVYVLAFEGQKYRVDFESLKGDASASVYAEGVKFKRLDSTSSTKPLSVIVDVQAEHVWIEVSMSALTVGDYHLTIEQLPEIGEKQ